MRISMEPNRSRFVGDLNLQKNQQPLQYFLLLQAFITSINVGKFVYL